jgi:hypothetical protein
LITPRHTVQEQWNNEALRKECIGRQTQLLRCHAEDAIGGRKLTLTESFAVVGMKLHQGNSQKEKGELSDVIELAVGMDAMVTFNINTELDIANRV